MKIIFLTLYALNTLYTLNALNAQSQFQRTIGGTGDDFAYSIIQTTDGGYAVSGVADSFNGGYIVKLSANGTLQWSRIPVGVSGRPRSSIIQTTDGGYAVTGSSLDTFWDEQVYIAKLNASGTLQWDRLIGGAHFSIGYFIIQTTDGGYAIAGTGSFVSLYGSMYIVKLDRSGFLQWIRNVGSGVYEDEANSIIQTTDGGYAVAGFTTSYGVGDYDIYIIRLNSSGTLQWSRTIGGLYLDNAYSIIQTEDGGYALAGGTGSFGEWYGSFYIVKLSNSGIFQWNRTVNFGGTTTYVAYSIIQSTDGGYVVAGGTPSYGSGNGDMYIVKLDAGGMLQWSRTVGGNRDEEAFSIIQTADGGYVVAGKTNSFGPGNYDCYIVKLDASGNTCGNSTSPTPTVTSPLPAVMTPNPTVTTPNPTVTTPTLQSSSGGTVTTICVIGIHPISNEIPKRFSLSQNYPNPFNPVTKIEFDIPKLSDVNLIVYDILGREVTTLVNEHLKPGTYEADWDGTNYPSGVYFYKLITESFSETKRMVLVK